MFLSRNSYGYYHLFFVDELDKRHRVSTRSRLKADALKFLRQFREAECHRRTKLQRVSLSEFKQSYLQHSRSVNTPKTVDSSRTALSEFLRVVGDLPLHKIGVRDIEMFLAKKKAEASAWTAKKYYRALAAAFETAKRWGHIPTNPFRSVAKPRVPEIQPAFLARDEVKKLLVAITDQDFRELVYTAVSTGMRMGELLALQWDALDFARRVILVQNTATFTTKNKRSRVVPMTEGVWSMLMGRKVRVGGSNCVFHRNGIALTKDYVSKTFKRYVVRCKLDSRLHFHSLRHTFASWLGQDGVSLYALQKLLGHSSASVT